MICFCHRVGISGRPTLFDLVFIVNSCTILLLPLSPRNLCFLSFGLYPGVGSQRRFQGLVGGVFLWSLGCADGAGSDVSFTEPRMAWLRY